MPMQNTSGNNLHELQVNNYEGSYYLFSKRVNLCQGDCFSSVGAQTGAIKLAMAQPGSYSGLVASIFSIVGLLILCG